MFDHKLITFLKPGANREYAGTQMGLYSDLNVKMELDYFTARVYCMGTFNYQSVPGKDEDNYSPGGPKDTTTFIRIDLRPCGARPGQVIIAQVFVYYGGTVPKILLLKNPPSFIPRDGNSCLHASAHLPYRTARL